MGADIGAERGEFTSLRALSVNSIFSLHAHTAPELPQLRKLLRCHAA